MQLKDSCSQISDVSKIKYLGVWIDNYLSWSEKIKLTTSKVRKLIFLLKNLKLILGVITLKIVYYALAQSELSYLVTVWGTGKNKLKVLKVLSVRRIRYHSFDLYNELQLLIVRKVYLLNVILRKHFKLPHKTNPNKHRTDRVLTYYKKLHGRDSQKTLL